ncbi:hypothetical protein AJ79_09563 [Helicocarpus griseus UAMH5409]|uniref:Glycosyltransferase family 8 protein n=1 Tax=Helicocarpus griseus UAMH5409 TaxID=1447875 RepID=A0A2B7WAD3_9EURO|nr:hypothetical protein AJ79_09563 [Helicocarpus griseus UAMH5409]
MYGCTPEWVHACARLHYIERSRPGSAEKVANPWFWRIPFRGPEVFPPAGLQSQRIIYATYLGPPREFHDFHFSPFHNSSDPYFDAARILTYQILHAPATRTRLGIGFVVFVHEGVGQKERDRLRRDGAQVVELKDFTVDWVRPKDARWVDIMTKLRLWQMVQYDLIVFLDADSVLTKPLDDLLSSPDIRPRAPKEPTGIYHGLNLPLPETYLVAGLPQLRPNHSAGPSRVPEDYWNWVNLNSGFLVLKPSLEVFQYFKLLLAVKDSFDGSIGDQSVLNHVFSSWGPMPWTQLPLSWNVQWPWPDDIWRGYAVLHEKWWVPIHPEVRDYFLSWYWRMEGYYSAMDGSSAGR